jgi:hypothetical protein
MQATIAAAAATSQQQPTQAAGRSFSSFLWFDFTFQSTACLKSVGTKHTCTGGRVSRMASRRAGGTRSFGVLALAGSVGAGERKIA